MFLVRHADGTKRVNEEFDETVFVNTLVLESRWNGSSSGKGGGQDHHPFQSGQVAGPGWRGKLVIDSRSSEPGHVPGHLARRYSLPGR